ncbi:MAG: integrase arm-type DNA-binding domain-containing protein [Deltaproteobacteria bacterium]|jgi:hypothetical protein|nr:integrase arm-type DNA-binding domain-containing protein [Deltaproteobacteria bacterium]
MLTVKQIENAQPGAGQYKLFDGGGLGLNLQVYPAGGKIWRLSCSFGGKRHVKSLGFWPEVSLKEAREKAAALKRDVSGGKDLSVPEPGPEKFFRHVALDWAGRFLPGLADKTRIKNRTNLEKKILPHIGDLRPDEITPPVILNAVLRPIEAAGKIETLHRVKSLLSQIFRYAIANGLMKRDFTLDLKGAFPPVRTGHRAAVTDPAELGDLLRAIDVYRGGRTVALALKILPYVFVRPGELRNAVWEEVSLEEAVWRIPAARMKMKTAHSPA